MSGSNLVETKSASGLPGCGAALARSNRPDLLRLVGPRLLGMRAHEVAEGEVARDPIGSRDVDVELRDPAPGRLVGQDAVAPPLDSELPVPALAQEVDDRLRADPRDGRRPDVVHLEQGRTKRLRGWDMTEC